VIISTVIDKTLRQYVESHDGVLEATLRRVVREEIKVCGRMDQG
jgi:hypothetical protein